MFDDLMAELDSLWGGSGWLSGKDLEDFKAMNKANALYGKSGKASLPSVGQTWNISDGSPVKSMDWGNAILGGTALLGALAKMTSSKGTSYSASNAHLGASEATNWAPSTAALMNAVKKEEGSWVNKGKMKPLK